MVHREDPLLAYYGRRLRNHNKTLTEITGLEAEVKKTNKALNESQLAKIKRKPDILEDISKDNKMIALYKEANPLWDETAEDRKAEVAKKLAT